MQSKNDVKFGAIEKVRTKGKK